MTDLTARRHRTTLFVRALSTRRPAAKAKTTRLTGEPKRDGALPRVINRAWRGDAGGALALLDPDGPDPYDDATELLADAQATFCPLAPLATIEEPSHAIAA